MEMDTHIKTGEERRIGSPAPAHWTLRGFCTHLLSTERGDEAPTSRKDARRQEACSYTEQLAIKQPLVTTKMGRLPVCLAGQIHAEARLWLQIEGLPIPTLPGHG